MKKLVAIFALASSVSALACQVQIDQLQMTNTLIVAAANQFNIALTQVSQMKAIGYAWRLHGEVEGSSCEAFLEHKATVTIKYQPSLVEKCELSVQVVLQEDLHAESYPFQTYSFLTPASSCVRVRPVIREPRLPRRFP
jgi:hypothetical protein